MNTIKGSEDEGLEYVYIGNIPGHKGENTYCKRCGRLPDLLEAENSIYRAGA